MSQVDDIRQRLAEISEDMADIAVSLLGRAIDTPEEHERMALANLEKRSPRRAGQWKRPWIRSRNTWPVQCTDLAT